MARLCADRACTGSVGDNGGHARTLKGSIGARGLDVTILTTKQVAELLQVRPSTVYAWAEQGIIPCVKLNGSLRYVGDDILQCIKDCKRPQLSYNENIQARVRKGGKG
jgi:excisionase family DNA binding protein